MGVAGMVTDGPSSTVASPSSCCQGSLHCLIPLKGRQYLVTTRAWALWAERPKFSGSFYLDLACTHFAWVSDVASPNPDFI